MFAVLILMMERNKLKMDVSGAWVREVSPMLATSRLFSPQHLGKLSYELDADSAEDSAKRWEGAPHQ